MSRASLETRITIAPSSGFYKTEMAFLEMSQPALWRRILNLAALNAAATMQKPMRDAAPRGRTGRLAGAVKARRARINPPAAVVGVKAGAMRGDIKGAWYRWFVTSGRRPRTGSRGQQISGVAARPFVSQISSDPSRQQRALEAYGDTVVAYFENSTFRDTVLKFSRRR
jgi:hypothetical protein